MLDDVINDQAHRDLAKEMLVSASRAHNVGVDSVDFGDRAPQLPYAWLCYLADPMSENRVAALTVTSAIDHFKRYDPNDFLGQAGAQVAATIYKLEVSSEAPFMLVGSEGEDLLISPWERYLVVVRASFNYQIL